MNTRERLTSLYQNPPLRLTYPKVQKLVFMSDSHQGFEQFLVNYKHHLEALKYYFNEGYIVWFLGDHHDLWRSSEPEIQRNLAYLCGYEESYEKIGQVIRIGGNHDHEAEYPEAARITIGETELFVAHGNQGEFINDEGWELGKFLVKYGVHAVEELGIDTSKLPGSDQRHEAQRIDLLDWANEMKITSIFGHTHRMENTGYYWNCGSGLGEGRETAEFDGELKLKRWK